MVIPERFYIPFERAVFSKFGLSSIALRRLAILKIGNLNKGRFLGLFCTRFFLLKE